MTTSTGSRSKSTRLVLDWRFSSSSGWAATRPARRGTTQPAGHHARNGVDGQRFLAPAAVHRQGAIDAFEMHTNRIEQALALGSQLDATGTAVKQLAFDALLQLANLVTERTDRQMRLLGCAREISCAGGHDKLLQEI